MQQPLRIVAATLIAGASVGLGAGPAEAKCCPLRRVIVQTESGESWVVEADELSDELASWDFFLISWPVFNNPFKGDHRPRGSLGAEYLVTYVHHAADYPGEVSVRERVYPFAEPVPLAFTLMGQRQDWVESDHRSYRVEWGWRQFPPGAVHVLFDRPRGSLAADDRKDVPYPMLLIMGAELALALRMRNEYRLGIR